MYFIIIFFAIAVVETLAVTAFIKGQLKKYILPCRECAKQVRHRFGFFALLAKDVHITAECTACKNSLTVHAEHNEAIALERGKLRVFTSAVFAAFVIMLIKDRTWITAIGSIITKGDILSAATLVVVYYMMFVVLLLIPLCQYCNCIKTICTAISQHEKELCDENSCTACSAHKHNH